MLKELIKLSNELDKRGLVKEADLLDVIVKLADMSEDDPEGPDERQDEEIERLKAQVASLAQELERLKLRNYTDWYDEQDAGTQHEHDRDAHEQDKMDIMSDFHRNEMDID